MTITPPTDAVHAPRPITVAYRGGGQAVDAIGTYTELLVAELRRNGVPATHLTARSRAWQVEGPDGAVSTQARFTEAAAGSDGLLVQYNPFSYGRWGVAPWLPLALRRLRRRGTRVVLMVHEAWIAPAHLRQHAVAMWQREQLRAMAAVSDGVFGSTTAILHQVASVGVDADDLWHLPVSSNLPDRRDDRVEARAALGVSSKEVVLVAFGTGHPSQRQDWVARAATASAAAASVPITVLNLGAGAGAITGLPANVRLVAPGRQPADELARLLACGDIFVAPFTDGISTRRTTVMAACQHALPVVGTRGRSTDKAFSDSEGFALVDAEDPEEFCGAVSRMASDAGERGRRGRAARQEFELRYSWDAVARRVQVAFDHPRT